MSVVVEHVSKHFGSSGEVAAVNDVSFEAPSGSVTTLLGPSGSGKSTLLRIIAGLERPDGGRLHIDGKEVTALSAREREVGLVFQSYALFRHLTVFENVAFGLRIRKAPREAIEERVQELLKLVQLEGFAQRRPGELSGGQSQRVALARALAVRPRVLLLDEPFGALDTRVRVELREWLMRLHEQTGTTTLLVTHDQEEALEVSDRIVLLEQGKLAQAGTPSELYERPATPFVAKFLGAENVLSTDPAVQAYVRPHDVEVKPVTNGEAGPNVARVERVVKIGAWVKLGVATDGGDSLVVMMPRREYEQRPMNPGDRVVVGISDAKLFGRDYVI